MGLIPGELAGAINFNTGGLVTSTMYWIGYGLLFLIIMVVGFAIIHFLSFKYSVTVYPLVGSGNTTELAVGKKKKNRFKWNKSKTAWKAMLPLFNKKEIEPFDPKYIYNGNHIVCFMLGEEYIPGCVNIEQKENETIQAQINPVPHYIRNWQSMEHKKNAIEFAKSGFWNENKTLIMIIATAVVCGAMVLGVSYMTYKFVAPTAESLNSLTATLKGFASIQGAP